MESGNLLAFYTSCAMPNIRTRKAMYAHRSTNSIGITTILKRGNPHTWISWWWWWLFSFELKENTEILEQVSGFYRPYLNHSWITTGVRFLQKPPFNSCSTIIPPNRSSVLIITSRLFTLLLSKTY